MINQISVDKDVLDFYQYVYFGPIDNFYKAASRKAYLDMCRTIRFYGKGSVEIRNQADELIENEVKRIIFMNIKNQTEYDSWHMQLCNKLMEMYMNSGIDFHIGQSQKWVNMTMKYLYILGCLDLSAIFNFFHVPLDNIVFNAAKKTLNIPKPSQSWSRMDDYFCEYMEYQKHIRESISVPPLRWEFSNWIREAKTQNN